MLPCMDTFELVANIVAGQGDMREALAMLGRKDEIVLAAYRAGFSKTEIHKLTGMARTTVDSVIAKSSPSRVSEPADPR